MKKKSFYSAGDPETAASVIDSCIRFCDVIISGKNCAAALKYDEENMFAPMAVTLENDASAENLTRAAESIGIPVIKNFALAKKLVSYGKVGKSIPESSYQDVSMIFARIGSRIHKSPRSVEFRKNRSSVPVKVPRPLSLELGASLFALTGEDPGREELLGLPLNSIRKKLIRLLGFSIPSFRVSCSSRLKNDEYRIRFRGLEAGRGRLELGWYGFEKSGILPANLPEGLGGSRRTFGPQPQRMIPDIMNNPENLSAAAKAASSALIRHVNEILQRRAPELLGRDEVEAILEAAEEKFPVVTGEVKSLLPLGIIREILMSIVSEQVSIRHIAVILETLADWGSFGPAPSETIVEQIRQSLKRQICLEYADEDLTLRVLTLEQKLEKDFASHSPTSGIGINNPVSVGEEWLNAISFSIKAMEEKGFPPVILCSPAARSAVKEATRRKIPNLAVLSYMEIPPDINIQSLGEISVAGNMRFPGFPDDY